MNLENKKIRAVGAAVLVALWLVLTGFSWFGPAKEMSESERRPLEQMPEISKRVIEGVKAWATIGADRAMNVVNTRPQPKQDA